MTTSDSSRSGADRPPGPADDSVRAALAAILASPTFARSPRMTGLLRYVVEETLAGRQDYLKEYSLALDVFERDPSFDTQTSPIVRVQASKLRRLLALYYADEGRDEPLRIELPKGSYVPIWIEQAQLQTTSAAMQGEMRDASPVAPPEVRPPNEPERRQLTVLLCQLVESAELTERYGAEEAFAVVRGYQAAAGEAVQKYAGHLTHHSVDGLVAYFGYPRAAEDDTERAVRAGLALIERISALRPVPELRLKVRIGIATGLVVVGEVVGYGGDGSGAVVGDVPHIAAGLRALAADNQVVIGARTHRLVQHVFDCADLGSHQIQGCPGLVQAWEIRGLKPADSRFEANHRTGPLAPVRGRDQEIALLLDRWRQACNGEGQVVLLGGEPGIGKSRIVRALVEALGDAAPLRLNYQCSPYHTDTALRPVIEQLERAAGFGVQDSPAVRLDKLESLLEMSQRPLADDLPAIADLLSLDTGDRYGPATGSPQRRRQQLLRTLLDQLLGLAQVHPVVLIIEDAHWLDPTTLELADMMVQAAPDAHLLMLITHRPDFPVRWATDSHVTRLSLNRLARQACAAMVCDIAAGKSLPNELVTQILTKTDGVPLFVEEVTKTVYGSAVAGDQTGPIHLAEPLASQTIPDTLRDSLMARLDRMQEVKEVAQTAAVIGREFDYGFLDALMNPVGDTLRPALGQLQESGLIVRRHASQEPVYAFKHALVQDTAYQSLLGKNRRRLHARIAELIQTKFPQRLVAEPELVAHHATEAGLAEMAIRYWEAAGRRAVQRSANTEAAHHFGRAIELLAEMPSGAEYCRQELKLQLALGSVEMSRKGYAAPDIDRIYRRARALCEELEDSTELAWVLHGVFMCRFVRGDLSSGRAVAAEIHALAQASGDTAHQACANVLMGDIELYTSKLGAARTCYEQTLALYDRAEHGCLAELFGDDPAVVAASQLGATCWLMGYPDEALRCSDESLQLAGQLGYTHTLAFARLLRAWLHHWRREADEALKWADAAIVLNTEHGFPDLLGWATGLRGAALCQLGESDEGLAEVSQGIAISQGTGAEIALSWFFGALAEGFLIAGGLDEALAAIEDAYAVVEKNDERFWEPELHRLRGETLLAQGAPCEDARACLTAALELAAARQLKSLELRSAVSLARFLQVQGETRQAQALLSGIYAGFSEGFGTHDLSAAQQILSH